MGSTRLAAVGKLVITCDRCRGDFPVRLEKLVNEETGTMTIKTDGFVMISSTTQQFFADFEAVLCRKCVEESVPEDPEESPRGKIEIAR